MPSLSDLSEIFMFIISVLSMIFTILWYVICLNHLRPSSHPLVSVSKAPLLRMVSKSKGAIPDRSVHSKLPLQQFSSFFGPVRFRSWAVTSDIAN